MKMSSVLGTVFSAVAVVLEALPWGARLRFASPEGASFVHVRYFSYFDPITYGYANFAPLVCAFLTVCTAVLMLIWLFSKRRAFEAASRIFFVLAALTSLWAMLTNFGAVSILVFLSLSLGTTCVFMPYLNRKD